MQHPASFTAYFPLTLTLSLREREQQMADWCLADGPWAKSGTGVIEAVDYSPSPQGRVRGNRV